MRVEKSGARAAPEAAGHPAPPYIPESNAAQHPRGFQKLPDRDRYQTVYTKDPAQKLAAPTGSEPFPPPNSGTSEGDRRGQGGCHAARGNKGRSARVRNRNGGRSPDALGAVLDVDRGLVPGRWGARLKAGGSFAVGTTSAGRSSYASHLETHEGREIPSHLQDAALITPGVSVAVGVGDADLPSAAAPCWRWWVRSWVGAWPRTQPGLLI